MEQGPAFKIERYKKKTQDSKEGSFHIKLQNENEEIPVTILQTVLIYLVFT